MGDRYSGKPYPIGICMKKGWRMFLLVNKAALYIGQYGRQYYLIGNRLQSHVIGSVAQIRHSICDPCPTDRVLRRTVPDTVFPGTTIRAISVPARVGR
eukprot:1742011-Rhodomonas_salina.1